MVMHGWAVPIQDKYRVVLFLTLLRQYLFDNTGDVSYFSHWFWHPSVVRMVFLLG